MKAIEIRISAVLLIVVLSCVGRLAVAAQQRQDAFSGAPACSVTDARPVRAFDREEAVRALAPCMRELAQRYGVAVSAEPGAVGVDGGRAEAPGILIRVPAEIRPGCHVLMDLSFAVRERRQGRLLGWPAGVWSGSLAGPEPVSAEGLAGMPAWLDRPSLRLDAKLTQARLGCDVHVILFDKDDNEVELSLPAPGAEAVVTFVRSTDEESGPYKAASLDAGEPGALRRTLASVPIPAELDASIRKAVQDLFGRLPGGGAK
ncbi:MAG: hypothetical protein NTY77_18075 [Elusimicrobia bacterium]|nr:hypothetical protein [Elusimicrobiota bacterium]